MLREALKDGLGLMYGCLIGAVATGGFFIAREEWSEPRTPACLTKDESDRMRLQWYQAITDYDRERQMRERAEATIDDQRALIVLIAREKPETTQTVFPSVPRLGDAPEDKIPPQNLPTGRE